MDVIRTYCYRAGETMISLDLIISIILAIMLIVFGVCVGFKILYVCNIYIKEHKEKKNNTE